MKILLLLLLVWVTFDYSANASSSCYRMGLIEGSCSATTSANVVLKTVPGPQGPPGKEGKACTDCGKNEALVKRITDLEEDNKATHLLLLELSTLVKAISNAGGSGGLAHKTTTTTETTYTYKVVANNRAWNKAREDCKAQGGDLAYHGIKTYEQRKALFNSLPHHHYHVGMTDEAKEGEWRYVDGSKVNMKTIGWRTGEPNGGRGGNAGSMFKGDFYMNDVPISFKTPYICEFVDVRAGSSESKPALFQSYNFPTYNFGIKNGNQAWIVPDHPHRFKLVSPGLSGVPNSVSFKSESNPNSYLRHSGYVLWLHPFDKSDLYKKDATFMPRYDLFYKGYTVYESVNFPGRYIRHQSYRLKISQDDGSALMHKDSSFLTPSVTEEKIAEEPPKQSYTYKAIAEVKNWYEAREYCVNTGGDLAYHGMKTYDERRQVFQDNHISTEFSYHLNINDVFEEGTWRYGDASVADLNTLGFGKSSNEPNGGTGENFALVFPKSYWLNDGSADYRTRFICEYPNIKKKTLVLYIINRHSNWKRANEICKDNGGSLAYTKVDNFENRKVLLGAAGHPKTGSMHIGFTDGEKEGVWRNLAGDSFTREQLVWNNSYEGKENRNENCAIALFPSTKLADIKCNGQSRWFLCQRLI